MNAVSLIIILLICGLTALGFLVTVIVQLVRKKYRKALIFFSAMLLCSLGAVASGIGILYKGATRIAAKVEETQEKWRKEAAEREKAFQVRVDRLKKYSDPDIIKSIDPMFYTYAGFRDWYRLPLVYPYEVTCIDVLERGQLSKHNGKGPVDDPNKSSEGVIWDVTRFTFDRNYLLLRCEPEPSKGTRIDWILFQFKTGKSDTFTTGEELIRVAKERGYTGDGQMHTIRNQYDAYY